MTTTTTDPELASRLNDHQHQQATTCSNRSKSSTTTNTSRMFLNRRRNVESVIHRRQDNKLSEMARQILSHALLFGCLLHVVANVVGQQQQPQPYGLAEFADQQAAELLSRPIEILVQPGSARRIECRLPSLEKNPKRIFHWNLVRSSTGKMNILCVRDECPEDSALGIQLKNDSTTNAYDLIIPKVSYDQHDGLYSCYYRDAELNRTINRDFRLTVLIPPQPPTISAAILAREGQEYQLNCTSQGGNPEPQISWFKNGEQLGQPAAGFIKIEQRTNGAATTSILSFVPTAEDHQAVYRCKVWNKAMGENAAYEREYVLQVEYSPRISVGQFQPLRVLQGSPVTLSCLVDANPPVKGIKWFKDGTGNQPISNQFNHTILEARTVDAGEYTCQADNGIAPLGSFAHHTSQHTPASSGLLSVFSFGSSSSSSVDSRSTAAETQLQLQVLYGPRVSIRPYPQMASPRQLNERDSFALNCSVDASPAAFEIVWTKADDPTFRRVMPGDQTILEFGSLSATDSGNYTCTAFNRLNPSSANQQQLVERQGSSSYTLMVRHKPGEAHLELGSNGETELGTKTQLVCRAKPPGYPEPVYKFYKLTGNGNKKLLSKHSQGPAHTIHAAKGEDEAKYSCEASNDLGPSTEASGELVVNEPPEIIKDSILKEDYALTPGDGLSVTVRASGKPEPKVRWFHRSPVDGRIIELSGETVQSRYEIIPSPSQVEHRAGHRPKYTVTSTLKFRQPLEVNDRGQYTAEFDNGLSRVAAHRFQLHIQHSPIPAPKNQPIVAPAAGSSFGRATQLSDTQTKAGFELNETVNLTCRVSAYPEPQFEWHDKSSSELAKPIGTNTRYRATVSNPVDDIWESTLTFDALQEADYGDYLCVTANQDPRTQALGESIRIIVTLVHKAIPDIPSQLEAIDASQDSVTLQWIPGFDGGGTNLQYQVQYAPDDGTGQSLSKRYANSDLIDSAPTASLGGMDVNSLDTYNEPTAAIESGAFPRLQSCQSPNTCTIEHLTPRRAYLFRVRARNNLGKSEFSDQLRASTRANLSQIPKILDASYDTSQNILYFRVEPGSDYLLNNLNARIEARSFELQPASTQGSLEDQQQQQQPPSQVAGSSAGEWRLHSLVPLRSERAQAHLNMQPDAEQLKITLCSKSNESICGPEFVISLRSAASSFLQDQRGLSVTMLAFSLLMIAVVGLVATSIHSCCMSRRKNKKADAIERPNGVIDNKPVSNGGQLTANGMSQTNGSAIIKGSHGSTTSTNSTSATNGVNGLQSMDSIVNGVGGASSDHSSDHSRQAKLDSMLPPNYNHYADRASILMEQQQQQQQAMQMQQQGLMSTNDKLGSPFGLANNALLGVANHHHQMPSPMMNGSNYFTYGQTPMDFQQQQQQQQQQLDDPNQMLGLETADGGKQQQQMWPNSQMDEYSNYNPLAYSTMQNQQSQDQQQIIDPTYGTAASLMMSQQSAAYDNSSNQFQSAYMSSQYQQELANAQQQMYGTLTRNGYSTGSNNTAPGDTSSLAHDPAAGGQQTQQQLYEQQYGTTTGATNGLAQQAQESDYGTAGARRPIREIIV